MAERSLSHLNYGHAGPPTFDLDTREWFFGRQIAAPKFKQIGIRDDGQLTTTEVVPSPIQLPSAAVSTRLTDASANVKALLHNYPEIAPAADLLPELAVTSAAVLSVTATYDPLIGNLFSTGSITYTYEGTHETRSHIWENPRRVAATVTGEAGNILRVSFLYREVHGWDDDKSVWIKGDTLRETESGYWNEESAPIQQVCFAQSQDRSQLLAVRLLRKIVIFRPIYAQRFRPAAHSPCYDLPPSVIDLHPVLILNLDQSGGSPHADVTFNPDFQFQFAVVNQNGVWSVWDIENKRQSTDYTMSCLVQGPIAEDADLTGEDGWARILWIGDVNTVLVCNRRLISVIGIKGSTFERLPFPVLFSTRSSDWILDVQTHPLHRGQCLVLTSTNLFLIAVTTSSEALDATADEVGARILLSWRHYRGPEDFTLKLSVQTLDEDNMCVMLYSHLNTLTQVYTFSNSSSDSAVPVSSANATRLELAFDQEGHTTQMTMEPFQFQGDVESSSEGFGRSYFAQGLKFVKLFVLRSDLSVHETIVCSTTASDQSVEDIAWSKAYPPNKTVRTTGTIQEMDDFLEAEGDEAIEGPVSKLASQAPQWLQREVPTAHRVVDHTLLYDALTQEDANSVDVPSLATQIQQLLAEISDPLQIPLGTLNEFSSMPIKVTDVDEASSLLRELMAPEDDLVPIRVIASVHVLQLGDDEQHTISSLYDSILQHWIASLPPDVPLRVRQRKERLARRVAAEVILASTRLQQRDLRAPVAAEAGPSQDSDVGIPILSSQPLPSTSADPIHWMSSQPLPMPSFSQSQPQPAPKADPSTRLRQHLKFKEESIPSIPISDNVTQLLAHWQPGSDPSTYDWEAIERADRMEHLDERSQQMVEKARKKRERRQRKQQREDELARLQPSSQPFMFSEPMLPASTFGIPSSQNPVFTQPTTYPRSSPGPIMGGVDSSSQLPFQPFPQVALPGSASQISGAPHTLAAQSQVEPGRFGGRPDKKKKKKNRVSGF